MHATLEAWVDKYGPLYRFQMGRRQTLVVVRKDQQDVVGDHVDLLLARRAARAAGETADPKAWFNAGWLSAEMDYSARRARKALKRAGRGAPFW